MSFVPCRGCQRHVRVTETVCPFCEAAEPVGELRVVALPEGAARLSRAALVLLGATIAGSACGSTVVVEGGEASGGSGSVASSSSSSTSSGNGGAGGVADGGAGGAGGIGTIGPMYGAPAGVGGFVGDGGSNGDMYGTPPPP